MKGKTELASQACVFDLEEIMREVNNTDWNSTASLYLFEEKSSGLFPIALEIKNLTSTDTFSVQT
jgi:hypothetical protein